MTRPKIAVISAFFALMLGLNKQGHCEKPFEDSVLLWNPLEKPKIKYVCLLDDSISGTQDPKIWPVYSLAFMRSSTSGKILSSESMEGPYYGRISSLTTEDLIPYLNLEKIEQNLPSQSFWESHYEEYLSQRQTLTIKENLALVQLAYLENNDSSEGNYSKIPYTPLGSLTQTTKKATNPTSIATYLLIGGFVCLFLNKFAKSSPEGFGSDKRKIILARRKRWLRGIYNLGLIEKSTFQKLLKRLEVLPSLIEALGLKNQSKVSLSKVIEKDLKRANSGESVVRTNEMSEVKTSR